MGDRCNSHPGFEHTPSIDSQREAPLASDAVSEDEPAVELEDGSESKSAMRRHPLWGTGWSAASSFDNLPPEEREEIVNDRIARVLRVAAEKRAEGRTVNLEALLWRAVRNRCIDAVRRQTTRRPAPFDEGRLGSNEPTPAAIAEHNEDLRLLVETVLPLLRETVRKTLLDAFSLTTEEWVEKEHGSWLEPGTTDFVTVRDRLYQRKSRAILTIREAYFRRSEEKVR